MHEQDAPLTSRFRICGRSITFSTNTFEKVSFIGSSFIATYAFYCLGVGAPALTATGFSTFVASYALGYLALFEDDRAFVTSKIPSFSKKRSLKGVEPR